MRVVLAFDTSTEECAVGLGGWPYEDEAEPVTLGELNLDTPRAALSHLVPTILRLLEARQMDPGHLDGVLVGRGPGSFTGVRIGMSTAKGLAQGLRVPLWGVGTLEAIAENFAGRAGLLGIVGDAMRGEVYPALFRGTGEKMVRLDVDRVCRPEALAQEWARVCDGPVLLAGNGLRKYGGELRAVLGDLAEFADVAHWTPTGGGLLAAAWRTRVDRAEGDPALALPVYTRLSDAEEAEGRRGRPPVSGVAGPGARGGPA